MAHPLSGTPASKSRLTLLWHPWPAFSTAFLGAWAPADEYRRVATSFFALRHTTSVAEYNSNFFALVQQAGYVDSLVILDLYLRGLKPDVYKALESERRVVQRMGSSFADTRAISVAAEAIDISHRASSPPSAAATAAPHSHPGHKTLHAHALASDSSALSPSLLSLSLADATPAPTLRVRPPGPIPLPPHGAGPRPRGPLTKEERAYRLKGALCAYCESPDHDEEGCEALRARNKGQQEKSGN